MLSAPVKFTFTPASSALDADSAAVFYNNFHKLVCFFAPVLTLQGEGQKRLTPPDL